MRPSRRRVRFGSRAALRTGTKRMTCITNAPWTLGIHPYVHPGRTRCMRHGLPHARRIGRGMLLLLLPLRAFGHGRIGKFVDRAVAAGTLENPIAAGVDHSRHLGVAWHIFPCGYRKSYPGWRRCRDGLSSLWDLDLL